MKKLLLLLLCVPLMVLGQELTVEIEKKEGIYIIYPGQKPTFDYQYVETIDAGRVVRNWRASALLEKLLKVFKKKSINGDALIFIEDDLWKADVIKFRENKSNKITVEIEKKEGIYIIYPGQKPTFDYQYVETIDAGRVVRNWRASTLLEKLLKVFKKKSINGDALIFIEDDLWKADVIKLQ